MAAPLRVQSRPSIYDTEWWELCNRNSVNVFSSCFCQGSNFLTIFLLAEQNLKKWSNQAAGKMVHRKIWRREELGFSPLLTPGGRQRNKGLGSWQLRGRLGHDPRLWKRTHQLPGAQSKRSTAQRRGELGASLAQIVKNGGRKRKNKKEQVTWDSQFGKLDNKQVLWRSLCQEARKPGSARAETYSHNETSVSLWCGHIAATLAKLKSRDTGLYGRGLWKYPSVFNRPNQIVWKELARLSHKTLRKTKYSWRYMCNYMGRSAPKAGSTNAECWQMMVAEKARVHSCGPRGSWKKA